MPYLHLGRDQFKARLRADLYRRENTQKAANDEDPFHSVAMRLFRTLPRSAIEATWTRGTPVFSQFTTARPPTAIFLGLTARSWHLKGPLQEGAAHVVGWPFLEAGPYMDRRDEIQNQALRLRVITSNMTARSKTRPRMIYCNEISVPRRFMPFISDMYTRAPTKDPLIEPMPPAAETPPM